MRLFNDDETKRVHSMWLPQRVIVGEGVLDRLTHVYSELEDVRNIFVVTGKNVYMKFREKIEATWGSSQKVHIDFAGQAVMDEVERISNRIKNHRIEMIIAFGGGRVIDLAKMAAYETNLEFISIPTTASHDGIASSFASIKGGGRVYSYTAKPPKAIIVDIGVICDAPRKLISSGVGDALAKTTAVRDWMLSHMDTGEYFGEYAAQLALMGVELVMKNAEGIGRRNKESIRTLMEALISDGVAAGIAGSSRPCSGSEHLFSHALDLYSTEHALHGEQCGVGTIMMTYLHDLEHEEIRNALKKAGAPTNARELGISADNIIKALVHAREIRPERYTILNKVKMDREDALKLAKITGVLD